jgi:hypothetical protein
MANITSNKPKRITPFKFADAPSIDEIGAMDILMKSDELADAITTAYSEGIHEGNSVRMLFSIPGMSLTYAWFKSGYPLPPHSHNADCLYLILAGDIRLGALTLSAGDGAFVPADNAYTFETGPEGVQFVEFRTVNSFDMNIMTDGTDFWPKAMETVRSKRTQWASEPPPSPALV